MTWFPHQHRTANDGITFEGEATGGAAPVQAMYKGNVTASVPDGGQAVLTWDVLTSGTELLDRSDPTLPLFLAAGTYAITAVCSSVDPLSVGGYVSGTLSPGAIPFSFTNSSVAPEHDFLISLVVVIDDTSVPIELDMNNADGMGVANVFGLAQAIIVKLA